MRDKILITGYPHSGTTILRTILGRSDDVYEVYPKEKKLPSWADTQHDKRYTCIKWPRYEEAFFLEKPYNDDYYKIFILRDPLYALSSLYRRGKTTTSASGFYTVENWFRVAKDFISLRNSDRDDVFCVIYQDLFLDDYRKLEELFAFLSLEYDRSYLNLHVPGAAKVPYKDDEHMKLRYWQIEQPVVNNNEPSKITLPLEQQELITSNPVYKELFNEI